MRLRLPALLLALASCGRCGRDTQIDLPPVLETPSRRDAGVTTAVVRAYPPHAIRADGVGPDVLGQVLKQVLRALPEGPNLELLQLGRYANWRVARAEGGAIVIGADAENVVRFVSVLGPGVARTSAGVGVGATGAELVQALGPPEDGLAVVRDRRVFTFASLPTVSFLTAVPADAPADPAKVVAVLVSSRAAAGPARRAACVAGPGAERSEIAALARGQKPAGDEPVIAPGCVTGPAPEVACLVNGELVLIGGEPGKLKRLAALPVSASFVGLLDLDGDGREEIVTGSQGVTDNEHWVEIQLHRWEAGKLVPIVDERPFVIGAAAAAGAGVVPSEIELGLEIRAVHGELEVGGFYLPRRGATLRLLAPVTPVTLTRRVPGEPPRPVRVSDAAVDGG